jgi:signal recognition particle receptor subunit beta
MWHELSKGAIGSIVLVDTRRLEACFAAVDFFEKQGVPFLVAVNTFHGEKLHSLDEVASALAISASVPIVYVDARHRLQVQGALIQLVEHALTRALEGAAAP